MGLDVTHGTFRLSYGGFSNFRNALCEAAGWTLEKREYEDGMWFMWPKEIDGSTITEDEVMGDWKDRVPDDPLVILMAHSDCDGCIRHDHLEPMARRLEALGEKIDPKWRPPLEKFIESLRLAHASGDDLGFC